MKNLQITYILGAVGVLLAIAMFTVALILGPFEFATASHKIIVISLAFSSLGFLAASIITDGLDIRLFKNIIR